MAALSFFMVGQVLFTLAEGSRQLELKKVAIMTSDTAAEAMMADYCRPMWDYYHLLAYDAGSTDGSLSTLQMSRYLEGLVAGDFAVAEKLLVSSINLLRLAPGDISFDSYTLLTDGNGSVYGKTIASYMAGNLLLEEAKAIYGNYESMNTLVEGSAFDFSTIRGALGLLGGKTNPTPARKEARMPGSLPTPVGKAEARMPVSLPTPSGKESEDPPAEEIAVDCPMLREVDKISAKGILKLVLPEGSKISAKSIKLENTVSHRKLEKGVAPVPASMNWYDRVLVQQYLIGYLNNYCSQKKTKPGDSPIAYALSYELEYLITGKSRDEDNLKGAVERILLMREAANFLYLESNAAKKAEVEAMAEALGLVTVSPAVYEAVKIGLLAAWAYVESVMDVRTLLSGGKIALIKSDQTWSSSLSNLVSLLQGKACAKSSDMGHDYAGYLGMILFALPQKSMAYRAMDVQEAAIRGMEFYSDFRMDHSICAMKATITYRNDTLFLSFVDMLTGEKNFSDIVTRTGYSYWDKDYE